MKFRSMHLLAAFMLALCSSALFPIQENAAQAAEEPGPLPETMQEPHVLDAEELEQVVLPRIQEQIQMSIDLGFVPQGNTTKFACLQPPYNCPANERCPLRGGGQSICVVTDCGTGTCPTCPIFGNLVVTSWCSYVCFDGGKAVTSAAGLWIRQIGWYFMCIGG